MGGKRGAGSGRVEVEASQFEKCHGFLNTGFFDLLNDDKMKLKKGGNITYKDEIAHVRRLVEDRDASVGKRC